MKIGIPARALVTATALLALSACQKQDDAPALENMAIRNVSDTATPVGVSNAAEEKRVAPGVPAEADSERQSGIPVAFRGRWGMTSADCDLSRSDTKGLVTVSANELKFYESLGRLKQITQVSPTEVKARFDFSGEGQNWTKDMTLKLDQGGTILIRVEQDPAGTYRHEKCG